ncbi:MAG: phosphate acyltransferase PlsX [Myxococcales bacterium]|nr:phosphate acyltransferase PlsX [Myxococcales bacterium]
MGGDRAPDAVVEGAVRACNDGFGPVTLVGDAGLLGNSLARLKHRPPGIDVAHASDVIAMDASPAKAARSQRHSSLHVAVRRVRDGLACGVVSAGNSGALLAVSMLTLGRIAGCDRPAIAAVLPTKVKPVVLVDAGANVECRSGHLVQFALMGATLAQARLGCEHPRVGLLSNGTEDSKGTEVLRETLERLRAIQHPSWVFVGFIEGRDVPKGEIDVVVTDGFLGNVTLKLTEGIALALMDKVKLAIRRDPLGTIGALLVRRSLTSLRAELDWANVGGAPILGLNGLALAAHGASDASAIASAIRATREHAALSLVGELERALTLGAAV